MKTWFQFILSISLIAVSVSTFAETALPTISFKRLISFGDSLSDIGTYSQVASAQGGGKFTTNPGKIWIEIIASKLHLPLEVNRQEGFGKPVQIVGGFDYAQGGSRIALEASSDNTFTARPIAAQVGYFLIENKSFDQDDLVLIQGGSNDLFAQLEALKNGAVKPDEAIQNMAQAAEDFSTIVANLKNSGARQIIVINLPVIEQTPLILKLDPEIQKLVTVMVSTFNQTLMTKIKTMNINLIDFYSFDLRFNQNYQQLGFKNITEPACRIETLPAGSSLFCSDQTLVNPTANQDYKFADLLHPTSAYSKVVADFIFSKIFE